MMSVEIITGDCREILKSLPAASVQCCVTSPPYFGLRNYEMAEQIGMERTPAEYVVEIVNVFREVRRILRDDGTLFLNLGDTYVQQGSGQQGATGERTTRRCTQPTPSGRNDGLPRKNLIGIPWRVAFALQDDGWILRQDIIWAKPNPMPESVTDRCTKSHEYVFLLTKSPLYYCNTLAIAEPLAASSLDRLDQDTSTQAGSKRVPGKSNGAMKAVRLGGKKYGDDDADLNRTKLGNAWELPTSGLRNRRSVWSIATQPYSDAHFATMAPELAEICIKAGSKPGDLVLDPFAGAGTTGLVADRLQRDAVLIELNPAYVTLAGARITNDAPLFAQVSA